MKRPKLVEQRIKGRDYPESHSFGHEDPEGFEQMIRLYIEQVKHEKRALESF